MLTQRGTSDKSVPAPHVDKVTVVRYRTLRPRERLQAAPRWNRQRRTDPSEKWRGAVMPPPAGRHADEQRGGARDKRQQDKAQDGQRGQERRWDAERVGADAAGLERSGRTATVGVGRGAAQRRSPGKLRPLKSAPKTPNRFWDACGGVEKIAKVHAWREAGRTADEISPLTPLSSLLTWRWARAALVSHSSLTPLISSRPI